jgi:MFS family permease
MPLVAREQLHGGAELYGLIMGVIGLGSIVGSLSLETLKARLGPDGSAALGTFGTALALALFAAARSSEVAILAGFIAGAAWIVVMTTMFVSAQVALPDWMRGRGLAIFLTGYFGAMAIGSAVWGEAASLGSVPFALGVAAAGAALGWALTFRWKLETGAALDLAPSMHWQAPAFVQRLEDDQGPILSIAEYRIDPANAAEFLTSCRRSATSACATAPTLGTSSTTRTIPDGSSKPHSSIRCSNSNTAGRARRRPTN